MENNLPLKILLIDDDEDDRDFFAEALSQLNINCLHHEAKNGRDALDKILNEQVPLPNLIFLDINMPVMNGFEFLKEFKKLQDYAAVPVVIYSTSFNIDDMEEAVKNHAAKFITKPFTIKDLKTTIEKTIKDCTSFQSSCN